MNYAEIKYNDIANGVGVRTSLFVSGCSHHCKGCFNEIAWDYNYGEEFTNDILDNILKEIEYRLSDKQLKLNLTDRAKDFIINESYDQNYGARPIRRYVSGTLETLIATNIIAGNIKVGSTINIDVKDEELVLI